MINYEEEALKRVKSGSVPDVETIVYAILALKQSNRTQLIADAASYYVRHPDDPEAYARLATLVEG